MSKVSICSDFFSSSGGPHKNTVVKNRAKKISSVRKEKNKDKKQQQKRKWERDDIIEFCKSLKGDIDRCNITWVDDRKGGNTILKPDAAKSLTDTILKVNANFEMEPYIMSIASRYKEGGSEGDRCNFFYNNYFLKIAREMDYMTCIEDTDHGMFRLKGEAPDDIDELDADDYRNWYEIVEFLLCKIQKDYVDEMIEGAGEDKLNKLWNCKQIFDRFYYAYLNYDNVNISEVIFKNDEYYSKVCEGEDTEIVELCKSLQTMGESTYNGRVELQVPHFKISEYILSGVCPSTEETKQYAQVVQDAKDANNKAQIEEEEDITQSFDTFGIGTPNITVKLSELVNYKILDVKRRKKCDVSYAYFLS